MLTASHVHDALRLAPGLYYHVIQPGLTRLTMIGAGGDTLMEATVTDAFKRTLERAGIVERLAELAPDAMGHSLTSAFRPERPPIAFPRAD